MELRVNDMDGVMLCKGGVCGDICGLTENECKRKKKGSVCAV